MGNCCNKENADFSNFIDSNCCFFSNKQHENILNEIIELLSVDTRIHYSQSNVEIPMHIFMGKFFGNDAINGNAITIDCNVYLSEKDKDKDNLNFSCTITIMFNIDKRPYENVITFVLFEYKNGNDIEFRTFYETMLHSL